MKKKDLFSKYSPGKQIRRSPNFIYPDFNRKSVDRDSSLEKNGKSRNNPFNHLAYHLNTRLSGRITRDIFLYPPDKYASIEPGYASMGIGYASIGIKTKQMIFSAHQMSRNAQQVSIFSNYCSSDGHICSSHAHLTHLMHNKSHLMRITTH